ncbi:MAG TPA: hypothetical protein VIF37_13715 [Methylobacter sp.]|jgi:hypothetical protein
MPAMKELQVYIVAQMSRAWPAPTVSLVAWECSPGVFKNARSKLDTLVEQCR